RLGNLAMRVLCREAAREPQVTQRPAHVSAGQSLPGSLIQGRYRPSRLRLPSGEKVISDDKDGSALDPEEGRRPRMHSSLFSGSQPIQYGIAQRRMPEATACEAPRVVKRAQGSRRRLAFKAREAASH